MAATVIQKRYDRDRDELVSRGYPDSALERHAAEHRAELACLERDLILKLTGIVTAAVAVVGALGIRDPSRTCLRKPSGCDSAR
jgi:hypothetical protein